MTEAMCDTRSAACMCRRQVPIDRDLSADSSAQGVFMLYTGDGKGKTSAALGLIARALGHDIRVAVVQFKHSIDTGETIFFRRQPGVAWHVMGEETLGEARDRAGDIVAARQAWEKARQFLSDETIGLVVLDELIIALKYHYLEIDQVLQSIAERPPTQHVVVTGRDAQPEMIALADTVTDMSLMKHALSAGIGATRGVEF